MPFRGFLPAVSRLRAAAQSWVRAYFSWARFLFAVEMDHSTARSTFQMVSSSPVFRSASFRSPRAITASKPPCMSSAASPSRSGSMTSPAPPWAAMWAYWSFSAKKAAERLVGFPLPSFTRLPSPSRV